MKCKGCRYLSKDTFENTRLHTCNMFYYLIQKWNKTYPNKHIYSISALTGEDDECKISVELNKWINK